MVNRETINSPLGLEAGISFWETSAWSSDLKANTRLFSRLLRVANAQHTQISGRRKKAVLGSGDCWSRPQELSGRWPAGRDPLPSLRGGGDHARQHTLRCFTT